MVHALRKLVVEAPPGGLPALPAAVEVAVYHIALEAFTNVVRHAQAKHCWIRFELAGESPHGILQVDIIDDGIGLPDEPRPGVGLSSMRERAAELGGTCAMVPVSDGGTRVMVHLPLAG